jgi:hypothetical protein
MKSKELINKKLNAIMEALIYKIENEPNYQRYSDYGTPEGAYHVIRMEKLIRGIDPDIEDEGNLDF